MGFLASLLAVVLTSRDFALSWAQMGLIFAAALGTQAAFVRLLGLPWPGPLSPAITGLSLCLLLRSGSLWVPPLAAALAIGSKFVVRRRGKHFFNPSLFGLCAVTLLPLDAWVSPGQWGSGTLLGFGVIALGGTVVGCVGRADISLSFLGSWLALLLGRTLVLGHALAVFAHQALSGALLVFAFFMISDPRSTPDARAGRVVFAVAVACTTLVLRFELFWSDALLWALLFVSPLTPLIDRLLPRDRFEWQRAVVTPSEAPRHAPVLELQTAPPRG